MTVGIVSITENDVHTNGHNPNGHIPTADLENSPIIDRPMLRSEIERHLRNIGLWSSSGDRDFSKHSIRLMHKFHREETQARIVKALGKVRIERYVEEYIANGDEIVAEEIAPIIELVDTEERSRVFRFATLFWSIPVSLGYGRRMRFLVRDQHNGKLIGVFALCDPVFNLRVRDEWIGWDQAGRRERLVNTMSAYVVGAVQPYSELLGGKLVTALVGSKEVGDKFAERYGDTIGHISKVRKNAKLTLATFTSALGRSSIYNRVRLYNGSSEHPAVALYRRGFTEGFGHFQISEDHFRQLRKILEEDDHPYISPRMGTGPNWRIRVARAGLEKLGFRDADVVLRHGIRREVYVMPIADNARAFLAGEDEYPHFNNQLDADEISSMALHRWIIPRSKRRPNFQNYRRDGMMDQLPVQNNVLTQPTLFNS